jgi:predicted nucleic acid-binding protein
MVLVDTSIWIDHFRNNDEVLQSILNEESVVTHPFIIGELACGNFSNRTKIIELLNELPCIKEVSNSEYMLFLEHHHLWGLGIGFVDIHLLAAAAVTSNFLFTRDKALLSATKKLHLEYF